MIYRTSGIILILISLGAVIAHFSGLALPTLDWFFSFESKDENLVEGTWWQKYQGLVIGILLCSLTLIGGLLSFKKSFSKSQWNPQTIRKLKRFKSITRGYVSLWILAGLLVLTL